MVTNPNEQSIPEEILLGWYERDGHKIMLQSNQVPAGRHILSGKHLADLRSHLAKIHSRFSRLYGRSLDDVSFAMEIEFKITKDDRLAIKQARPWVF